MNLLHKIVDAFTEIVLGYNGSGFVAKISAVSIARRRISAVFLSIVQHDYRSWKIRIIAMITQFLS